MKNLIRKARKLAKPFRVTDGKPLSPQRHRPGRHPRPESPRTSRARRKRWPSASRRWPSLQDMLYAQDRWGVLLIFQAMDAAGKDGAIKHVMSGVNPQGCQVYSFKAPSAEDLDHDYLWRCLRMSAGARPHRHLQPQLLRRNAGRAGAPGVPGAAEAPARTVTKNIWKERFQDIRSFERYLARNGIVIRKFFLHVSKKEQKRRFLERVENPSKNWKFSANDARSASSGASTWRPTKT